MGLQIKDRAWAMGPRVGASAHWQGGREPCLKTAGSPAVSHAPISSPGPQVV